MVKSLFPWLRRLTSCCTRPIMTMDSGISLFSGASHAEVYAKYRPNYPQELYSFIMEYCKKENPQTTLNLALDIGCGSGQNTLALSKYFQHVIGLDVSDAQINQANKLLNKDVYKNVEFKVSAAENLSGIDDASVDLATFACSFHWLEAEKVYAEMKRVLKPGGVISIFTVGPPTLSLQEGSDVIFNFERSSLAKYWSPKRKLSTNRYRDVHIPFRDSFRDETSFATHRIMPLSSLIGVLRSWSAYQSYLKEYPEGTALENVENSIRDIYQKRNDSDVANITLDVIWPIYLLLGRK